MVRINIIELVKIQFKKKFKKLSKFAPKQVDFMVIMNFQIMILRSTSTLPILLAMLQISPL
jgi:hypothetical protein